MVNQHISSKLKHDILECNVKELQIQTFYQKSDNKCFLIGVQPAYKEAVYDKNFWPTLRLKGHKIPKQDKMPNKFWYAEYKNFSSIYTTTFRNN
jgi:hypothetical protein